MNEFSRIKLAFKALHELGPSQLGLYALYQLGLRTGHFQRKLAASVTRLSKFESAEYLEIHPCIAVLPDRTTVLEIIGDQVDQLYTEAEEILKGNVRPFGGHPVALELTPLEPLENWTKYESGDNLFYGQDIKFIWEQGRFAWACKLAMAYHLSGDERYAESFWLYTIRFIRSNPPYDGPHWSSAQEVAIRLVNLAFAIQAFAQSKQSSAERLELLAKAIVIHAERIPPTLVYARSQNNNHLITEALGLYTASAVLPDHPMASRWHALGWRWLLTAFRTQISADGTYTQHSTNYHRLMLQAALWAFTVQNHSFPHEIIPSDLKALLAASARWLWKLVDPISGRVPNLGHNDGAYILPLSVSPFHDFRPVIYAAARTFLDTKLLPSGAWDDMSHWLCSPMDRNDNAVRLEYWHLTPPAKDKNPQPPHILSNQKNGSWAMLRAAKFHSRPAHADQLHVDLWWRGLNLAQDPGTYLYNAPSPWENSLTSAYVHNTVVVDGKEFMLRAGRFLYLDWAQGKMIGYQSNPGENSESLTAEHDGYRKIGLIHSRRLTAHDDGHWEIIDHLDGLPDQRHNARLHWLLPDWKYEILKPSNDKQLPVYEIRIYSPYGWVNLKISFPTLQLDTHPMPAINFQLARAGTVVYGSGTTTPITGWTSATYGDKIPALACIIEITQALPIVMKSEWFLPSEG